MAGSAANEEGAKAAAGKPPAHVLSRVTLDLHVAYVSMGVSTDLGASADAASLELRALSLTTLDLSVMRHNEVVAHVSQYLPPRQIDQVFRVREPAGSVDSSYSAPAVR